MMNMPTGVSERRKQGWVGGSTQNTTGLPAKDETVSDIGDDIVRLLKLSETIKFGTLEGHLELRRGVYEFLNLAPALYKQAEKWDEVGEDIKQVLGISPNISLNQKMGLIAIRHAITDVPKKRSTPRKQKADTELK